MKGGYLPLSDFKLPDTRTLTYYLLLPGTTIESGSTYVMQEGESLTIQKASTQETMATYTAGDSILLANLTITRAPSATDILSTATNTISLMAPKSSTISDDHVYFLCLNSKSSTKNITPTTPYTLEEGEYFIWADAGVTEYVTLGPGTELTVPTGSITLKVHNNYDIASVLPSDFEPLPSSIDANFYKITTFAEGDTIQLDNRDKFSQLFDNTKSGQYFIPSWTAPKDKTFTVKVTTKDGNYFIYNISSADYSIRHLAVLRTTEKGYALTSNTSFKLSPNPDGTGDSFTFSPYNDPTPSDDNTCQSRLYSSIALSGFAGSLLTTSPFSYIAVTTGLVKNSQGVYEEELNISGNATVQGLRQNADNSTIPSPYDLKISYSGVLEKNSATIIATFRIPLAKGPFLFRFRRIKGTEDKNITFSIMYSTGTVESKVKLTTIDSVENADVLSFADYVFVVPAGAPVTSLEITLFSPTTSYTKDNPFQLEAAIEDISIIDSSSPFDPQLGLTLAKSGSDVDLPTQLGGSDDTSDAYKLLTSLTQASKSAVEQNKTPFNWLYYSLDRLSNPLDPQSFFLPAHPKNSKVFPLYIEDATKIKFPQRG